MTGTIEGAGILDNANTDGTVTFATAIGANTQVGEIESSIHTGPSATSVVKASEPSLKKSVNTPPSGSVT